VLCHYHVRMVNKSPTSDPLNRPEKQANKALLLLASDVLVASTARRLAAFIIDACIILILALTAVFPMLMHLFPPLQNSEILRLVTFSLFGVWGIYVVTFNASPLRATVGQLLLSIQVCTVFGGTLSVFAAIGRFIVCTAPVMCLLVVGVGEIIAVLPKQWRGNHLYALMHNTDNEMLYTLLMVPALMQFILIWPLLTSNYTRVLWDKLFHSCVLLRAIRKT
jgi:uncharacterized RDD family membrane protein YckC